MKFICHQLQSYKDTDTKEQCYWKTDQESDTQQKKTDWYENDVKTNKTTKWKSITTKSIYLSLFVLKAQKYNMAVTYSRQDSDNNYDTEHCSEYIKTTKNTIASDQMK